MHVSRLGLTPLKGARHLARRSVLLDAAGPAGDRAFCLVDPVAARCLRTVEHPALLGTEAEWDGERLVTRLPGGLVVEGEPAPTGERLVVDYWGRPAAVEPVAGPWAAAYARLLGRDVVLARCAPGVVVFDAPVSLVTRSSLAALSRAVGAAVDPARFRATLVVDDGPGAAPDVDQAWAGRRLHVGAAELRVLGPVDRCAVVEVDPVSGRRDLSLLRALAARGRSDHPLALGVDAEVLRPGRVRVGDPVALPEG
ncbi:MOSC domain-containing protein [Nocardioides solisilvae]|uniref:MOSC domain-containing protein n=1 Tax=Nocardioides solisilvae TaxID=1542435 RepID=UPI000D74E236|nr:MOSC domain-containing protein [Nocardioides solisilvae]